MLVLIFSKRINFVGRIKLDAMNKSTPVKKLRKLEKAVRAVKGVTFVSAARKKGMLVV